MDVALKRVKADSFFFSQSVVSIDLYFRTNGKLITSCTASVVQSFTQELLTKPPQELHQSDQLKDITFGDPTFDKPGKVDILLGIPITNTLFSGEIKCSYVTRFGKIRLNAA